MPEILQLHIHIHISDQGVTVSNAQLATSNALDNSIEHIICQKCGADFGAPNGRNPRRVLAAHKRLCVSPEVQSLRTHVENIFAGKK